MSEGISDEVANEQSHDPAFAEVKVTGPGVTITRPVDEATMANIIALLFGASPAPTGSGGGGGRSGQSDRPQAWDEETTLGEFIMDTDASTFQQKICAAGYYLMNVRGAESFTSGDVKTALADAHEDMPGNFSRDFSEAASKNYIAKKQGGEAGQFIVPRTGRTAVESNFQDVPKRRARRTARKSSSNSSGGGE